ncbi:MAG: DUF3795 domain-containing protein [Candidatus Thorarchaeota archaeon]
MSEIIVYCGLDCSKCDAFKATQTEDLELKKQIAERWTRELGTEFTPQDIECDGCKSQRISGWCQKICLIRPCAEERGVETCAHCSDYPCDKIEKFLLGEPVARNTLEEIRRSIH